MQHANTNSRISTGTDCPLRGGPCRAGMAFMARLDAGLRLAQQVTGAAPDMAGEVVIETCPACSPCRLQWQASQGVSRLQDGARVLLHGDSRAPSPAGARA